MPIAISRAAAVRIAAQPPQTSRKTMLMAQPASEVARFQPMVILLFVARVKLRHALQQIMSAFHPVADIRTWVFGQSLRSTDNGPARLQTLRSACSAQSTIAAVVIAPDVRATSRPFAIMTMLGMPRMP